jgi:hypothetical protein
MRPIDAAVLGLLALLASCSSLDSDEPEHTRLLFVPGMLLVTFANPITEEAAKFVIEGEFGFELHEFRPARPNLLAAAGVRGIPKGEELLWAERLVEHELIRSAAPNYVYYTDDPVD